MQPLISLRGIKRHFLLGSERIEVLHGIDLDIYAGEFIAIIGASGSGKSTLMNILGTLDQASGGSYLFKGNDLSRYGNAELSQLRRKEFGFVFQSYHLIPTLNARENVEIPLIYAGIAEQNRKDRASALLHALGLGERMEHYPAQLSGGQQQRVSIARALANGGGVILADEPTGALDSKSGEEVMRLFSELHRRGHTIILITHDSHVASYANRIIEMKDGRITHAQIEESHAIPAPGAPFLGAEGGSLFSELFEAVKMAIRSLKTNLFRTILTLIGIVIGVASVIVMLALGEGAKTEVMERISAMGTNILLVRPGMPNMRGFSGIVTLVPEDVEAIRELGNIAAAIPESRKSITARYQNNDQSTSLIATSSDFMRVRNWYVEKGVFFTLDDERNYAKVAVLGKNVERALFGKSDGLGNFVLIDNILFEVIGVLSERGASMMGEDQDDVVLIPYTTGSLYLIGERHLRHITVAMEDISQMNESENAIRSLLLQRHGIEDFRIHNMASLIADASQTQDTFTLLLGSVAAISLLVGGIGVMNIMLVSVTERTKEIGIRMAVGGSMKNILQQFLVESVVISALGGLLGVIVGIAVTLLIDSLQGAVSYSAIPVILAFGCSFLSGVIFGYLPAKKAAKLSPVAALSLE